MKQLARAVYPMTPSLVDWLNHELLPVEQHVFEYFERIGELVNMVEEAARTKRPALVYAAKEAIKNYNEDNFANLQFDDVLHRTTTYLFTDIGEWVLYCNAPTPIMEHPELGLHGALEHDEVNAYQIFWNTKKSLATVYRSPYWGSREVYDRENKLAYGFGRGSDSRFTDTFTLPPDIEAAVSFDLSKIELPRDEELEALTQ